MSFLGLVSDKAPKNMEEIARLNWIIQEMERMNVVLRDERDVAKTTYEGVLEFQKTRDKERNSFVKQINKLKMEVVLEKKTSFGLTQKLGALQIDLTLKKEERAQMMEEQIFNRQRVKEMEKQLNDDRSKRLRNLHENELLRTKNVQLEARCSSAEAAEQKASRELLEKLQVLDTTLELVASQKRTIEAQGAEMLELNREVTMQKEALRDVSDRCLRVERQLADRQKEKDAYEQEAFRLRREIMQLGTRSSEKASAFSSYEPRSRLNSAASTARPNTTMSMSASGRARTPGGVLRGTTPSSGMMSGVLPGSAGGSTFGTDSIFLHPELDSAPQLTPLATPGDRRPRTRQALTAEAGSDGRAGSYSPLRPSTGGQLLRNRTAPAAAQASFNGSEVRFEPEASELTEGSVGMVQFEDLGETDRVGFQQQQQQQQLAPLNTPGLDSPATQSSPFFSPAKGASMAKRKGNGKGKSQMQQQVPLSELAASYMLNTRSPGTGLRSLDGSGKNGVGIHSIHSTHSTATGASGNGGVSPKGPKNQQHISDRARSGFVGSGLGLRQEPIPAYSVGGGPKAVLARILAESEKMD
jgi:hypothetical protein